VAVAAALACDTGLAKALLDAVSLLGTLPLLRLLSPGGAEDERQAAAAPQLLAQRVRACAMAAAARALAAQAAPGTPLAALGGGGGGEGECAGGAPAPAASAAGSGLLAGLLMADPVCRALQLPLLQLAELGSLEREGRALAELCSAATTAAAQKLLLTLQQQQQHQLQAPGQSAWHERMVGAVSGLLQHGKQAGGRSPADAAAHQQLLWVLQAHADGLLPAGAPVLEQLVPALVHEAWCSHHAGLAMNSLRIPSRASRAAGDASLGSIELHGGGSSADADSAVPLLHTASMTAAVQALLEFGSADVRSKQVRLVQLRLAVRQLQQLAAGGRGRGDGGAQPWRALASLLAQLLLAHGSAMATPAAAEQLASLAGQLAGGRCPPGAAAQLQHLLSSCSHEGLKAAAELLLLPCLDLVSQQQEPQPQQAPQTPGAYYAAWSRGMLAQGRAWLLLGLARLQLVAPPAGIDPAGKYGLKQDALRRQQAFWVEPELQVGCLAVLEGGGAVDCRAVWGGGPVDLCRVGWVGVGVGVGGWVGGGVLGFVADAGSGMGWRLDAPASPLSPLPPPAACRCATCWTSCPAASARLTSCSSWRSSMPRWARAARRWPPSVCRALRHRSTMHCSRRWVGGACGL
jgi:hypothetical protein